MHIGYSVMTINTNDDDDDDDDGDDDTFGAPNGF